MIVSLRILALKLTTLLLSLWVVASISFVLMHTIPGDPFLQEQAVPEEILHTLRAYYGLDKPLFVQYCQYVGNLLQGDLGPSFKYEGRSVLSLIVEGFPVSLTLGIEALAIAILGGVSLGSLAAVYRDTAVEKITLLFSVILISVPNFIIATELQFLFSVKLGLLPVARWGTFAHSILPAISLATIPLAFIARITRANVLEVMQEEYVLAARAKGLSPIKILWNHTLKNALLPLIGYLGPLSATILTGSFIIEKIFGIPGLGNWLVSSITNRDYTVIMGVTIFYSFILLMMSFITDLILPILDPRIRLRGGAR